MSLACLDLSMVLFSGMIVARAPVAHVAVAAAPVAHVATRAAPADINSSCCRVVDEIVF
jgi:hypothetical protein